MDAYNYKIEDMSPPLSGELPLHPPPVADAKDFKLGEQGTLRVNTTGQGLLKGEDLRVNTSGHRTLERWWWI